MTSGVSSGASCEYAFSFNKYLDHHYLQYSTSLANVVANIPAYF